MIEILKSKTAMVVEDDEEAGSFIVEILKYFFDKVIFATSGEQAIDFFDNKHIDVLITDYEMPHMNGMELIKQLREEGNDIPIIVLSSYSESEKILSVVGMNLVDYVIKPITYDKMKRVLEKCATSFDKEITLSNNTIYHFGEKILEIDKNVIHLTAKEAKLIEFFIHNKNRVLDMQTIEMYLLDAFESISVKDVIYRLRKKIGENIIHNLKEVGYMMKIDD